MKGKTIKQFGIEMPPNKYFSDERLKKCFSKKVILVLGELYEKEEEFHKYYQKLGKNLLKIGINKKELENFYQETLHNKIPCCRSSIEYDGVKKSCRHLIKQRFYKKEKCFFCNIKHALESGHLIKQSILNKNKKNRGLNHNFKSKKERKYYEVFVNNIVNIIYLCGHHHNLLDGRGGKRLPNYQINRLIKNRKKINKGVIEIAQKEIKKYYSVISEFEKFEKTIPLLVFAEYKKQVRKLKIYSASF